MRLHLPKILYPTFDLPLDAEMIINIDYSKHPKLVKDLISKGWIEV